MKPDPFIATGGWLLSEGAKLVEAVKNKRPTPRQKRLAAELRSRAAHWKREMDHLTDERLEN